MDYLLPEPVQIINNNLLHPDEVSQIKDFYKNRTIFITGATGFLGKLILEKLLRTCPDLKKIYILVRLKNHLISHQRLLDIFELPIFERVKRQNPNIIEKVTLIRGDCSQAMLGLSLEDIALLRNEIECVFNCAATTMFDASLKTAAHVNVRAVRDLITIAKDMKQLKAFIHVSSVYVNCNRATIEESFQRPFISCNALLEFIDSLDPKTRITAPIAYKDWPNNYLFTKSIAEDVIRSEAKHLPIAIVRPSIVISTAKQPIAGWTDNINGPTGLIMTTFLGLTRSILAKIKNKADLVPGDYTINAILVAAWDIAQTKMFNDNQQIIFGKSSDEIPIYNICSSPLQAITWGKFFELSEKYGNKIPTIYLLKNPWHFVIETKSIHILMVNLLHYVPTFFQHFITFKIPIKSRFMEYYRKIDTLSKTLSYFTLNSWDIKNDNTRKLLRKLKPIDKELFDFDLRNLNWKQFFYTYVRGIRIYILKDELTTVAKAKCQYQKLKLTHYSILLIMLLILYFLIYFYLL